MYESPRHNHNERNRQKMKKILIYLFLAGILALNACSKNGGTTPDPSPQSTASDLVVQTGTVINSDYIGNGAQWDAYPNAYLNWNTPLTDNDWNRIYQRLDYMKPRLMRVTIAAGWKYARNGGYDPQLQLEPLSKILQYCTEHNTTVLFGDWGGGMVDPSSYTINKQNLTNAALYVDYLINQEGFSCIKYYNMINEPNGDWSSTKGGYDLWKNAVSYFYSRLDSLGLTNKLSIVAPDIAVWSSQYTNWFTKTTSDLGNAVGLYDIHYYPGQTFVRSGDFTTLAKAYQGVVPDGKKIVVGEMGFKYDSNTDADLYNENISRAKADQYAADGDCNMFVYDFFYGIDMSDALIQLANAGYSGMVAWMLDDAMHNSDGGSGKALKVWGFWNILGRNFNGQQDEEMRPWFYSSALLSRYMQTGSTIYQVDVPAKKGLKAMAVEKDGKYMIAILNSGYPTYDINLKFDKDITLDGVKEFIYAEDNRPVDSNGFPVPLKTNLTLDMKAGYPIEIAGQTLIVLTNFDY